ncbi:MAG: hypothetical protein H0T79_08790 [Deltaproteobacteria bacterium]|nr:hypothetical protein [Deltaproteobacteria bacterium]
MLEPSLSADGLRVVFATTLPGDAMTMLYYRDRASLDAPFGPAMRLLPARDALFDPVLTEDCGRLYVRDARLSSLLYLGQ